MHYGFIGLGNLGTHLAASLLRGGFQVTVHDLSKAAATPLLNAPSHRRWRVTLDLLVR